MLLGKKLTNVYTYTVSFFRYFFGRVFLGHVRLPGNKPLDGPLGSEGVDGGWPVAVVRAICFSRLEAMSVEVAGLGIAWDVDGTDVIDVGGGRLSRDDAIGDAGRGEVRPERKLHGR